MDRRAKRTARNMGLDSLSLIAKVDNQDALGLYRKQGFKKVKEIPLQIIILSRV